MDHHSQLNDNDLEKQFADLSLPAELFSHEAHLRLAWIHLRKYGEAEAIQNLCGQIKAFAESLGAHDKFHKTLTVAAIKAVHHFMKRSSSDSFDELIAEYPRLGDDFKALICQHYPASVFTDERAKKEYLEPNLLPFT